MESESQLSKEPSNQIPTDEFLSHVTISADLPPGSRVRVTLEALSDEAPDEVNEVGESAQSVILVGADSSNEQAQVAVPLQAASSTRSSRQASYSRRLYAAGDASGKVLTRLAASWRWDLPTILFVLALIIYLFTRLYRLLDYPIYFFSDEAMQSLFAERLIKNDFMDTINKIRFPLYVEVDGGRWSPLLPIYLHALTLTLFGKTAFVTRATSAIFTLLAVLSVSMILKQVFRVRFWWLGALLLAVTPAWFLHSRTAFETAIATSLYAVFLWLYFLYRTSKPKAIFPATLCAAAAFYSYSNAQAVLGLTVLLFLISDLRYHWEQRRVLVWLIPMGIVLLLPLLIFEWRSPQSVGMHLRVVGSYWFHDIPLAEKLKLLVQKYLYGLSPQYWFFSNTKDLERHRMGTMPHILTVFLPFFLVGIFACLRRLRSPMYRILLLATLAIPIGAAQLDIGITRVLMFVILVNIFIVLGLEWLWQFLEMRLLQKAFVEKIAHWSVFCVLAFGSLFLLSNAISNGPLWFRDYGLYGMQYGATQLFDEAVPEILRQNPDARLLISPTWANGTDRLADFFLLPGERERIQLLNIDGYLFNKLPISESDLFIMPPNEFEQATMDAKFAPPIIEHILYFPDGLPGFYVVHLSYSSQADAIFAAEDVARKQLQDGNVTINKELVQIRHSMQDMGSPQDMFDNDRYTLMRGMEANPLILDLTFQGMKELGGIVVDLGALDTTITATLILDGQDEPFIFSQTYLDVQDKQELELSFDKGGPYLVSQILLEFFALNEPEPAHIHVRELRLLP